MSSEALKPTEQTRPILFTAPQVILEGARWLYLRIKTSHQNTLNNFDTRANDALAKLRTIRDEQLDFQNNSHELQEPIESQQDI